jgi:NlpC/P60 family/Bacterial dipeptidyl-peptidase Sh3 domain
VNGTTEKLAADPRLVPKGMSGEGEPMRITGGSAALRRAPEASAEQVNQALFGEGCRVFDRQGEWAYVQLDLDRYVGWMRAEHLRPPVNATHRVRVLRTFLYERPDMKSRPFRAISMNARLAIGEAEGNFSRVADFGWVFSRHVAPLGEWETDFVGVAQHFLGSPYLWGGRESAGLDCSGLVQVSLQATGVSPLRDSDMQEQTLGEPIEAAADYSNLKRGDLVFWKGHVGIMQSATILLHASARDLHVELEPLAEAVARIRPIAGEVRSVRRLQGA